MKAPRFISTILQGRAEAARLFDLCMEAEGAVSEPEPNTDGGWDLEEGAYIGRYRLMTKLGEGGFGIVWMAEQTAPIHRQVAIKVIKPGMDSREVVARFENEREALALMDHPNVCKVLDAGATGGGRPYVVMDLVRGTPLTEYCDRHRLSLNDRVQLFLQVCRGVQHAHQKAILHRDLKPSNILVMEIDGRATPKIIDFGIAKAIGGAVTLEDLPKFSITRAGTVVGTPEYMSPEQAEMGVDVDVLSDVYSLGAIFYELLTGVPPLPLSKDQNISFRALLKRIAEFEAVRPSLRLSRQIMLEREEAARARSCSSPAELEEKIRGDFDWIALRALEREPRRRYESAAAFATDLERHLEDRPVHACPPSRAYVLGKWIRRHKTVVAAGVAIAACLVVGSAAVVWTQFRARSAQARAEIERNRADLESRNSLQVANFLDGFLGEVNLRNNGSIEAGALRELLNSADNRRRAGFATNPAMDWRVSNSLAKSYCELNQLTRAAELYAHALDCMHDLEKREGLKKGDVRPTESLGAAECMYWLAWTQLRQAEETGTARRIPQRLRVLADKARSIYAKKSPGNIEARVRCTALVASLHRSGGNAGRSAELLKALNASPDVLAIHGSPAYGWILREQALLAAGAGSEGTQEALELLSDAERVLLRVQITPNRNRQVRADILRLKRQILKQAGDNAKALQLAEDELKTRRELVGYDDPNVLAAQALMALEEETPRVAEAAAKLKLAVEVSQRHELPAAEEQALQLLLDKRQALGPSSPFEYPKLVAEMARVVLLQGDAAKLAGEEAQSYLSKAETLLATLPILRTGEAAALLAVRAKIAARRGDYKTAHEELASAAEDDPENIVIRSQAAQFAAAARNPEAHAADCKSMLETLDRKSDLASVQWIGRALLVRPVTNQKLLLDLRDQLQGMALLASEDDGWTALLRGLLEYRAGEADEALIVPWLEYAQRSSNVTASVQASAVMSMFYARRDRPHAAALLSQAKDAFATRMARYAGTELLVPIEDFATTELLMAEASALLERR